MCKWCEKVRGIPLFTIEFGYNEATIVRCNIAISALLSTVFRSLGFWCVTGRIFIIRGCLKTVVSWNFHFIVGFTSRMYKWIKWSLKYSCLTSLGTTAQFFIALMMELIRLVFAVFPNAVKLGKTQLLVNKIEGVFNYLNTFSFGLYIVTCITRYIPILYVKL